jgi:hypothetical protein
MTGLDNHAWIDAIDRHPAMKTVDVLAGYHVIGAKTDITPEDQDKSLIRLQLSGFLRVIDISDDGRTYTYAPSIPGVGA